MKDASHSTTALHFYQDLNAFAVTLFLLLGVDTIILSGKDREHNDNYPSSSSKLIFLLLSSTLAESSWLLLLLYFSQVNVIEVACGGRSFM
jgi:hypothetical protein